jgi:hypothetical protein
MRGAEEPLGGEEGELHEPVGIVGYGGSKHAATVVFGIYAGVFHIRLS